MSGPSPEAVACMQAYRLLIFDRAVAPDFFDARVTRTIHSDQYELQMWLSHGTHLFQFRARDYCLSETITSRAESVPGGPYVRSLSCAGEQDHDGHFPGGIRYITTVQTEVISANLYRTMLAEMIEFGEKGDVLSYRWTEPGTRYENGSFVDVQRLANEAHVQTWHLDGTCGVIMRSQTIFELLAIADGGGGSTRR